MRIVTFASGSSGNCALLSMDGVHLLLDAGISWKRICAQLRLSGVEPEELSAVLITHEHSDHTKGLGVLTRGLAKLGVHPALYASAAVHGASRDIKGIENAVDLRHFASGDDLSLAGMSIHAFPTLHDAAWRAARPSPWPPTRER